MALSWSIVIPGPKGYPKHHGLRDTACILDHAAWREIVVGVSGWLMTYGAFVSAVVVW
jgi:hypothetical protein